MAEQEQKQVPMPPGHAARPSGPRPNPQTTQLQLTPKDIVLIFRRHILLIVSLTFMGIMLGGVGWFLVRRYAPKYTATTIIEVLPPAIEDPGIIGTRTPNKDILYGHRVSIAALIKQQNMLMQLITKREKVQETMWFQSFSDIKDERIKRALKNLKRKFGAYAKRDSQFVVLSMTCGNPEEAALIVNEMLRMFISSQGQTEKQDVDSKLGVLTTQQETLQTELRSAEFTMEELRKNSGFGDLEARNFRDIITEKLTELDDSQNELTLEVNQANSSAMILERQLSEPVDEDQISKQLETDPTILSLTRRITELNASLQGKLAKFGENHRVVKDYQQFLNGLEEERQQNRVRLAEMTRRANYRGVQDQLTVLTGKLERLNEMREEAYTEKAKLDIARVMYEQRKVVRDGIKDRLEETKGLITKWRNIREDPDTTKVKNVGEAPVPLEISSPKLIIYVPAGTMLGFMLGVGLAFLIELLNDLLRTPRDIGRYLHIPLLGVIPDAEEDGHLKGVDLYHVVNKAPYSIISESYRRFRTNLKFQFHERSMKVLLVTSGMAGDGKTSVASNLAISLAAENKRILLIDANFWQPSLTQVFSRNGQKDQDPNEEPDEFGLSTLLAGMSSYQEVIKPSGTENLDIIYSGLLPPNPAELLGSQAMQQLIKHQQQNYDTIIFDGPPVLLVSDVKTLARFVDATVLVFHAATTRRGAALRAIRELREVNAIIPGCILFAVKAMKGGYFAEQFDSYEKYQEQQLQLANAK
ncbi:GumC family protein [Planctomycetota bacterium]